MSKNFNSRQAKIADPATKGQHHESVIELAADAVSAGESVDATSLLAQGVQGVELVVTLAETIAGCHTPDEGDTRATSAGINNVDTLTEADGNFNGFGDIGNENTATGLAVSVDKSNILICSERCLSTAEIADKYSNFCQALRTSITTGIRVRRILRDMLDTGVAESLNIKRTQLLDCLDLTPREKKQAYRELRAAIVEKCLGVEPGTFCEYYARLLDAKKDPVEMKRCYEIALKLAYDKGTDLGSADIKEAIKLLDEASKAIDVIGTKICDEFAEGLPVQYAEKNNRNKTKVPKLYAGVNQLCNQKVRKIFIELLSFDDELIKLCHKITSNKTDKSERCALAALLSTAVDDEGSIAIESVQLSLPDTEQTAQFTRGLGGNAPKPSVRK